MGLKILQQWNNIINYKESEGKTGFIGGHCYQFVFYFVNCDVTMLVLNQLFQKFKLLSEDNINEWFLWFVKMQGGVKECKIWIS